jgi:TctA family transporter
MVLQGVLLGLEIVMPGLVPGIHVFLVDALKTWIAGTRPGHDEN